MGCFTTKWKSSSRGAPITSKPKSWPMVSVGSQNVRPAPVLHMSQAEQQANKRAGFVGFFLAVKEYLPVLEF